MSNKIKSNKSFSDFDKYSTYNELSKEFDISPISLEELFSLSETECNKLFIPIMKKKNKIIVPPQPPKWFSYWCETEFKLLKQDVAVLKQDVVKINSRLDNIVKLNNLKE